MLCLLCPEYHSQHTVCISAHLTLSTFLERWQLQQADNQNYTGRILYMEVNTLFILVILYSVYLYYFHDL